MTTMIVFAVSLLLAILLLIMKSWELRSGKRSLILAQLCKLDTKTERVVSLCKRQLLTVHESIHYLITVRIKDWLRSLIQNVKNRITKEYIERHNAIMGQKNIVNRGSVSFYLKKIDEVRKSGQKGEIN